MNEVYILHSGGSLFLWMTIVERALPPFPPYRAKGTLCDTLAARRGRRGRRGVKGLPDGVAWTVWCGVWRGVVCGVAGMLSVGVVWGGV